MLRPMMVAPMPGVAGETELVVEAVVAAVLTEHRHRRSW